MSDVSAFIVLGFFWEKRSLKRCVCVGGRRKKVHFVFITSYPVLSCPRTMWMIMRRGKERQTTFWTNVLPPFDDEEPPLNYTDNMLDVEPLGAIQMDLDEEEDGAVYEWFSNHQSLAGTKLVVAALIFLNHRHHHHLSLLLCLSLFLSFSLSLLNCFTRPSLHSAMLYSICMLIVSSPTYHDRLFLSPSHQVPPSNRGVHQDRGSQLAGLLLPPSYQSHITHTRCQGGCGCTTTLALLCCWGLEVGVVISTLLGCMRQA